MNPILRLPVVLGFAALAGWSLPAQAHRLSDACLQLTRTADRIEGRLDVPLRDLALVVPLDWNGDQQVTWGELKQSAASVQTWVSQNLQLASAGSALRFEFHDLQVADVAGEPCASLAWTCSTGASHRFTLNYRLFFATDPQHRGLVRLEQEGRTRSEVLSPEHSRIEFGDEAPAASSAASLGHFVGEGLHHIWIGFDHILFLLALLLPAVLLRQSADLLPAPRLGPVLVQVLKVVTAFTVAHSITLALGALGLVRLPSRAVETVIASSVALAGLNNLLPFFRDRAWWVAGGFGLIHGFGFASVLEELALPTREFMGALLGFNLGVELGQLSIVAVFLPVAFALRREWIYRRIVFQFGSASIVVIAMFWVAERAFGVS